MNINADDLQELFDLINSSEPVSQQSEMLTNFEIILQAHVTPLFLITSAICSLLTIVALLRLTLKTCEIHIYCLVASLAAVIAYCFQQRTVNWVTSKLGLSVDYVHQLKNISDVTCICTHFISSCSRQLPRYMLVSLLVECCIVRRWPRIVRQLNNEHTIDVIILNVVIILISNAHYFWTYGRVNIVFSDDFDLYYTVCKLRSNVDPSSTAIDHLGYIISGYTWLMEDFLPYLIVFICCVLIATYNLPRHFHKSQATQSLLIRDYHDECELHAEHELEEDDQINIRTGLAQADNNLDKKKFDNPYRQLFYGSDTHSLIIHTAPYLAVSYVICRSLNLVIQPVVAILTLYNKYLLNEPVIVLLEITAELCETSFAIVYFIIFLCRHAGFRRELLYLFPKRFLKWLKFKWLQPK